MYTYKIQLREEPEGAYTVLVPALPGCLTYGENVEEALSMAKEAIQLYIEVLKDSGEVIPDDRHTLENSLKLEE
ncbi:MAG: type II toxin-antitoxin system HicB family antitoxin [Saprospiraceae bacterium]|nr:type II toxin-antitoxin system HicB family antitoxin [Saprospiraceae bacterium]